MMRVAVKGWKIKWSHTHKMYKVTLLNFVVGCWINETGRRAGERRILLAGRIIERDPTDMVSQ